MPSTGLLPSFLDPNATSSDPPAALVDIRALTTGVGLALLLLLLLLLLQLWRCGCCRFLPLLRLLLELLKRKRLPQQARAGSSPNPRAKSVGARDEVCIARIIIAGVLLLLLCFGGRCNLVELEEAAPSSERNPNPTAENVGTFPLRALWMGG